jgi:hypothetical protein
VIHGIWKIDDALDVAKAVGKGDGSLLVVVGIADAG